MIKRLFLNDKFILGLILLNSLILFIGGAYFPSESDRNVLAIIDNLITTLFILELIVKFNEYRFKGYFESNWNKLDFILIILSIPTLITFIFNLNTVDFSFLLVFRIMRVFKAFRFFQIHSKCWGGIGCWDSKSTKSFDIYIFRLCYLHLYYRCSLVLSFSKQRFRIFQRSNGFAVFNFQNFYG